MITLQQNIIAAILNFAAHKDVRFYLNAVLVERRNNRLYVVATNGHVLGLYHCDDEGPDERFLIDETDLTSALRTFGKKTQIEMSSADEGRKIQLSNVVTTLMFAPVDGKFVDWSRAIPRECNGEVAQFEIDLLTRFKKAAKALGEEHVYIHHNGTSGALVEIAGQPRFVGVIMPMRASLSDPAEWLSTLP